MSIFPHEFPSLYPENKNHFVWKEEREMRDYIHWVSHDIAERLTTFSSVERDVRSRDTEPIWKTGKRRGRVGKSSDESQQL